MYQEHEFALKRERQTMLTMLTGFQTAGRSWPWMNLDNKGYKKANEAFGELVDILTDGEH